MTLTLLSLSSIFQDFFDAPEDDPLLQDDAASSPKPSGEDAEDSSTNHGPRPPKNHAHEEPSSTHNSGSSSRSSSQEDRSHNAPADSRGDGVSSAPPSMAQTSDADTDPDTGSAFANVFEALPDNLKDHIGDASDTGTPSETSLARSGDESPRRTRKFVVPYNASAEELKDVNDAISNGWSFRRISISKTRSSVKPGGKKIIITLELDKPRSLFDF